MNKILLLLFISFASSTATTAQHSQQDFQQLMQLEGTWSIADEPATFEIWCKVNDTLLEGKGFSVNGGDTTVNETLQLSFAEGEINYTAHVMQQNDGKPISFKLAHAANGLFTFENPEHDFPKGITYKFLKNNKLQITLVAQRERAPIIFEMNKIK